MVVVLKLLIAAVCEEFFFRGLLLDLLMKKRWLKPIQAALAISGLFSVLHIVNGFSYATWSYVSCQILFAFGISMLLCYLYISYNSILYCIFIHSTINLISILSYKVNGQGLVYVTMMETVMFSVMAILAFVYSVQKLIKM